MNFLNPLALIGLVASTIPVILHLINLRKLKTVEFSTLKFLKELQKTKIRRIKLKQILLLILRTLLIIFAVLAFARPTVETSLPVFGTYAKTSAVIIVDNSFSMDVSDERGNRFSQAKNSASAILNALREGDDAAVISMADGKFNNSAGLTKNIQLLRKDLSKITISSVPANLAGSVTLAEKLLAGSGNLNKEIYIITDGQPNIFANETAKNTKLLEPGASVYFVPLGRKDNTAANLNIDSVQVLTRIYQLGKNVEVEAYIRNHSGKDVKGAVLSMVFNNERVAQRTVDVPAGQVKTIAVSAVPQQNGINKAYLELEQDAIDHDNRSFFGFVIPDNPSIAIVGAASAVEFIKMALSINPSKTSNVQVFSPGTFSGIDLRNFDILICASGPYNSSDFTRIANYIRNGGAALVFADDNTSPEVFSNGMAALGFGSAIEISFSESNPAQFSSVDRIHPLFEGVFKGETDKRSVVESPKIYKMMPGSAGQPIIETPAGSFLSEVIIGEGKVLYCSVTPDTKWSTLPVTGLFPAMIYRSIYYLTSKQELGTIVKAGSKVRLNLPKKFAAGGNFRINDPENIDFYIQAASLPSGVVLPFDNLERTGCYSVFSSSGKPVSVFSVNVDPSESFLKLYNKDEIGKALSNIINEGVHISYVDDADDILKDIERARTGTELWQFFIILALLCALTEMYVAKTGKNELQAE